MVSWLKANAATIIISLLLILLVYKIIVYLKKPGNSCSSCGSCQNCAHCLSKSVHSNK